MRARSVLRTAVATTLVMAGLALAPPAGATEPAPPPGSPSITTEPAAPPEAPAAVEEAVPPPPLPPAPAPAARAQGAAAAAAVLESSPDEKVRAAAAIGVVAPDTWLVKNDRDFVFEVWRAATGPEVKASAELALAAGSSAGCAQCTSYIRSGIHDAQARDVAKEVRDATTARLAREAKARAAATIGIVAPPEMLILTDKDFAFAIWEQATGPRVKEAALAAFGGTPEQQAAFIATGISAANTQDQQDAIDAEKDRTEAEKELLRAKDAKSRAAAVLGIVATEEIKILSDDNFVRLMYNRSVVNTEVNAAALTALRSSDPAVWKAFIYTGIYEANRRDIDNELRARAAEDRRLAGEIRTAATNGRVRLALAEAARVALAGTDDDVATFLRVGQYQALVQSLRSTTPGTSAWYVSASKQTALTAAPRAAGDSTSFTIVNGLADPGCFSMQSVALPTHYLKRNGDFAQLFPSDGSAAFKQDATWCSRVGFSGRDVSLESFAQRGKFLRNYNQQLRLTDASGVRAIDRPCDFNDAASWKMEGPNPDAVVGPEDTLNTFCRNALFATGFETGELHGFINTVDTGSQPHGGLAAVSGVCCGLTKPELGIRTNDTRRTGRTALMYSGKDDSTTRSFAFMRLTALGNLPVTATTRLEYWIFPQAGDAVVSGNNSSCVAVDLLFSDNTALRTSAAVDQRGNRAHPASQCGKLVMNQWNFVSVPLSSLAGRKITQLSVGYEQNPRTGGYRGFIDDVMITR